MVIKMKDDCLFCKIVKGEVPSNKLYEDDDILVMMDAYPNVVGHSLVIPKKHYEDIYEVPDEVLLKMFKVGKKMTKELMTKLDKKALTYTINYGEAQVIKHIHLHLLPDLQSNDQSMSKEEVYKILKG